MQEPPFYFFIILVIHSALMLMAGLYILANYGKLFTKYFKSELLRQNVVVWMASLSLIMALAPLSGDFFGILLKKGLAHAVGIQLLFATANSLFIFNVTRFVATRPSVRNSGFTRQKTIVLITLILCTIAINIPLNYIFNGYSPKNIKYSVLFSFYNACAIGMVYIAMSYIDLEKKRKLNQKELEVARLSELKTKAELEALHSKINPHFLYNALNSIADLAVTDGKKARRMTIALADLFRFSINYSNNNYSTIREELEMAEVYLQIEKIRFEDQLNYSISVAPGLDHYLVPRFLLQPIVENAVKHGLKATGHMTDIDIEVEKSEDQIVFVVADNGPLFPEELTPGYGVKSIYDKLDLLFPDSYEVSFSNVPRKRVSISINKLLKNEPALQDYHS